MLRPFIFIATSILSLTALIACGPRPPTQNPDGEVPIQHIELETEIMVKLDGESVLMGIEDLFGADAIDTPGDTEEGRSRC